MFFCWFGLGRSFDWIFFFVLTFVIPAGGASLFVVLWCLFVLLIVAYSLVGVVFLVEGVSLWKVLRSLFDWYSWRCIDVGIWGWFG